MGSRNRAVSSGEMGGRHLDRGLLCMVSAKFGFFAALPLPVPQGTGD